MTGPLDDLNDIPAAVVGLGGVGDPVWDPPPGRRTRAVTVLMLVGLAGFVLLLVKDEPGGLALFALVVALVIAVPVVAGQQLAQYRWSRAKIARLRRLRWIRRARRRED